MKLSANKNNQPLIVAFDLDGVLLDNPTRILRSLISKTKKAHLFPRPELVFYHPEKPWEKCFWRMLHWSSFRINPGFDDLRELVKAGKIKAYIVSARFACLQQSSQRWLKKMAAEQLFEAIYFNVQDEQPHLFKLRLAKKLQVDYFAEDNFDVANHLAKNLPQGEEKMLWLSNKLDSKRHFKHKFNNFRQIINFLAEKVS